MDKEEIEEELAALRRGLEEMNGLYEALNAFGEALITTHPNPLEVARHLHRKLVEWEAQRRLLSEPAAQWLNAMRETADLLAGLEDPEAMARERRKREADFYDD